MTLLRSIENFPRRLVWGASALLVAAAAAMAAWYAPVEATMGPAQKIFYLHFPAAIDTFLAALVVFVGSVGYIGSRRREWDDLACAAAQVTVLYCTVVLITGMVWAKSAWGVWWTWSPRLTFSLVLWLLYVSYLAVRPALAGAEGGGWQRRAMVCAVYGIVAFLDVPLVYLSVKLLPDIHPSSIALAPEMKHTLAVSLAAGTTVCLALIAWRYRAGRRAARLAADVGGGAVARPA
ncbi:MAG: cytochrome c biogenesis protein CcsA [Phycisphaerales bacterium]